ncbi:SDR family NAD(P)-dependent oxidoreductase [Altererythrobacter sp. SALINAS58]|uniref:SDR family NAD(P)-dependent oxidoreductase n=1 Tax=Alteripontixanthobacter muriae TaxID=2705546 RepID=UPI001575B539|nr:SDR family NAD(P)-dependent oxidoreductase [Alteripontixanthobacter muriae]NTZ43206.1 SDR family NAD(P)-dependent oxidoreductase [Alteripontixanthobacter muriae]
MGRAHALELARHGARVVVNDLQSAALEPVVDEIRSVGGEAIGWAGSVTDAETVDRMAAAAVDRWGRIDILINNAGILRDKSFAKMELEDFRLVLDVHLMGAATCTKAVWDRMRAQKYGRIVMTTSSSGLYGNFGQANYGAAKMALVGLMQTLAIEGEKYGIKVNCLAPTAATQMTGGVLSEEALASLDPALVSPGIVHLCSEDAPTRTILCAGAGHFATANVTLTNGYTVGRADDAALEVSANWAKVADRKNEIVPAYGFVQGERELASTGIQVEDFTVVHG